MRIRIEPDWNVKQQDKPLCRSVQQIRIEPDWNVKEPINTDSSLAYPFRIEPDWNVKFYKTKEYFANLELEQNQIGM